MHLAMISLLGRYTVVKVMSGGAMVFGLLAGFVSFVCSFFDSKVGQPSLSSWFIRMS